MTMWHLLRSELVRFRLLAGGFAVIHLVILGFLAAGDLFAPSLPRVAVGLLAYALAGLLLGLYQMGTHARSNRWVYLVHRPLPPGRIHLALAAAAAIVLGLAVTLPQLLVTTAVGLFTAQPVDARHLLLVAYVFGTTYAFYLLGSFVALAPGRGALLVLSLPVLFLTRQAVGPWVLVPLAVVLLWLGVLARAAFKPALAAPLRRPWALAAAGLAMAYALFWLLSAGTAMAHQFSIMFSHAGWKGPAVFAWNDYFPPGSFDHVNYLDGADALTHGLDGVTSGGAPSERAAQLRGQIRLAEVAEVEPRYLTLPVRHQPLFMDRASRLVDEEAGVAFVFQHDSMLFHGRDLRTGVAAGWLGPEGRLDGRAEPAAEAPRFPSVPVVAGNRFLITADRLWEYDPHGGAVRLRFVAPRGERLVAPFQIHGRFATLLTDRALYLFDPRDLERSDGVLQPTGSAALPGGVDNLKRIAVAELIDGHLVSFLFGTRSARDLAPARQVVVEVGLDGSQGIVAERSLLPETFSVAYRHRNFVLSPALQVLHDVAWGAIAPRRPERVTPRQMLAHPPPPAVLFAALVVALASALLAAALARRRALTPRRRRVWTLACGLFGVPALLTLPLLTAPAEQRPQAAAEHRGASIPGVREAA